MPYGLCIDSSMGTLQWGPIKDWECAENSLFFHQNKLCQNSDFGTYKNWNKTLFEHSMLNLIPTNNGKEKKR